MGSFPGSGELGLKVRLDIWLCQGIGYPGRQPGITGLEVYLDSIGIFILIMRFFRR